MLHREGQKVNAKRVYRLWRENGLSHRPKARERRRIGSSSNSCVRLSPNYPNHVWSYDFLFDATADGQWLKWMPVIDNGPEFIADAARSHLAESIARNTTPNVHTVHSVTRLRRSLL